MNHSLSLSPSYPFAFNDIIPLIFSHSPMFPFFANLWFDIDYVWVCLILILKPPGLNFQFIPRKHCWLYFTIRYDSTVLHSTLLHSTLLHCTLYCTLLSIYTTRYILLYSNYSILYYSYHSSVRILFIFYVNCGYG